MIAMANTENIESKLIMGKNHSMNKKIKCAVIGLGGIGHIYSKLLLNEKIMDLVGACDIVENRRKKYNAVFPQIPLYETVDELIQKAEFDAALILTSDPCHAEPFIKCMNAKKHVFVEKPVGNSVEEIREMIKVMDCHQELVASSGHILRYYPINRKIKKMAIDGEFGKIFYMEGDYIHNLICQSAPDRFNDALGKNWYLEDEKPMVGGGCHPFDVLRWFANEPLISVSSMSNKIAFPAMRHDDCIVSIYNFKSGCIAKVTALYGCVAPYAFCNNIAVYGTKASVWRNMICTDHAEGWKSMCIEQENEKYGHGFEREIEDFAKSIITKSQPLAPARDCAMSEIATLLATEAAYSNSKIAIPEI